MEQEDSVFALLDFSLALVTSSLLFSHSSLWLWEFYCGSMELIFDSAGVHSKELALVKSGMTFT
jgi:hypothetical protein